MEIPARSMIGDIHGIVGALPPGWKKIGKKLRDIVLPPSDNGPSKEERQMIRLADVSKGFAYFDEFDELEEWTPESVDPIQRANVPLLPRAAAVAHGIPKSKSKVLLCHDYKGGYQDYEAIRPPLIDEEMYSCEYLQFVDTFVYFSHKLASLPPPTWTNAMHRNGVKVLGTFILEPQSEDPERMFRKKDGKFVIPTVLSTMAETFGFDGWLLNFEREFPSNSTNQLLDFIRELKRGLGEEKIVIWYDSLTVENKLHYQNALTINNLIFAQETDGFFTNYRWSEKGLAHSQKLALENGISTGKIFFGIDVWAQNTDMPGPPRVTWPAQGGGGTNTGYAMKRLSQDGFSTAIFAPAWTHEHFSPSCREESSISQAVNQSMWQGSVLPPDLGCDCHQGLPHHTAYHTEYPIIKYALQYPSGSSAYFETGFERAFRSVKATGRVLPQVALQSLLPIPVEGSEELTTKTGLQGNRPDDEACLEIYARVGGQVFDEHRLDLFHLALRVDEPLVMQVDFQKSRIDGGQTSALKEPEIRFGFSLDIEPEQQNDKRRWDMELDLSANGSQHPSQNIDAPVGSRITKLSAWYSEKRVTGAQGHEERGSDNAASTLVEVLRCGSIQIMPRHVFELQVQGGAQYSISNVRVTERGRQKRVAWDLGGIGSREGWPSSMPWSDITGPFHCFTIFRGKTFIGTSFCTEFPLKDEDFGDGSEAMGSERFTVRGRCFGGLEVVEQSITG